MKILRVHISSVTSITESLDDKIIGGSDSEIEVWDIESGKCLKTLNNGHTEYIREILQISNEIIASCDDGGKIIIWNINNGETLKTVNANSDRIWCLFKLSSKKIISCSINNTIKIWDIDEGICLKTLGVHTCSVCSLDLFD